MRILVSGAGVAGPAFAFWAARAGARVTLIEKEASHLPHGQNIDIDGSARKVIRKMGLERQVLALNTGEVGTHFIHPNGKRPFASFPLSSNGASMTSAFEILRGDLAKLLFEQTESHPNVEYRFSTTIDSVLRNDDEAVVVRLNTPKPGATVEESYDLLVVADGQWSRTRKQVFAPESVQTVDKNMYAIYWTAPRIAGDNDWWNIYISTRARILSVRPDAQHGTSRVCFTKMPITAQDKDEWQKASRAGRKAQQHLVTREFANAGWQAKRFVDSMDSAPDFYFQAVMQIRMSPWSKNRVVCLGDTAYAPSPLSGGGTSIAILGAYVLAGQLTTLAPSLDKVSPQAQPLRDALHGYDTHFRKCVDEYQDIPSFVPGIAHPHSTWYRYLLQTLIWTVSNIIAIPFVAKRIPDHGEAETFKLPSYPVLEAFHAAEDPISRKSKQQ